MLLIVSKSSKIISECLIKIEQEISSSDIVINRSEHFFQAKNSKNPTSFHSEDWVVVFNGDYGSKNEFIQLLKNHDICEVRNMLAECVHGCFNIAMYSEKEEAYTFISDHLSLYPWYYYQDDSKIVVSTKLSAINCIANPGIDEAGYTEFMRHACFVGEKTCLKEVKRLMPGMTLEVNCIGETVKLISSSNTVLDEVKRLKKIHISQPEDSTSEICDLLVDACKSPDGSTLMMSAGWDSRTLLAAILSRGTRDLQLYTHGDSNSREALIVKKIAKDLNLDCHIVPFSEESFSVEYINSFSKEQDNVIFPYWRQAARYTNEIGSGHIISGVLGEVLGGHYGPTLHLRGFKKALAVGLYLTLGKKAGYLITDTKQSLGAILSALQEYKYKNPWYIAEENWSSALSDSYIRTNHDIKVELESIASQSNNELDNAVIYELFTILNRGVQYIAMQALSSQYDTCDIVLPFCNRKLLAKSVVIPFQDKIHNKLNKSIISKLYPKLLYYPTSAILTNISQPIAIQEFSRVVRKLYEKYSILANKNVPSLGWANFNLIGQNHILNIADSLSLDVFDKELIKGFLRDQKEVRQHPLWDMVLKMKSIDNMCK